jgi:DNA polymerase elongation subunit (family B)
VFLKKNGASLEHFESLKYTHKTDGLSLESCYKFLVLLTLADEKMDTIKHYFGITQTNELIARGIAVRRHDTPNFKKEFQTELLYTQFELIGSPMVWTVCCIESICKFVMVEFAAV